MDRVFENTARPGNLGLSVLVFAGLVLVAGALWQVAAGYVLLLLVPALGVCFLQMVTVPVYGLRFDEERWTIQGERGDTIIESHDIAYLSLTEHGDHTAAKLVLRDGTEKPLPFDLKSNPMDVIQAATARGIEVRSA